MTDDRRTKAQILQQLTETQKRLNEVESQKSVTIERPARVPEAEALASCVRALDAVAERGQYGGIPNGDRAAVERVLKSLASRYRVEVFTRQIVTEPCKRAHVDQIDAYSLRNALAALPQAQDGPGF